MKIIKSEIKKINITSLFDQVDQSQITSDEIRNLFNLKPEEKANTPFIELPGTNQYITPLSKLQFNDYSLKEQEWIQLVGSEFANLPQDKKEFLLKTAGVFEFDQPIDIKRVYSTSIY